jgi:hypothetical protein
MNAPTSEEPVMPVTAPRVPARRPAVLSGSLRRVSDRAVRRSLILILAALALLCWQIAPALAQSDGPRPPCGAAPIPAYAPLDASPHVLTGNGAALPATIDMNACVHWDARSMSLVVLLAGQFRDDAGVQDLLARFGAISRRPDIRSYSAADAKAEAFITAASAVTSPDGQTRRGDFTPAELADGAMHYFVQQDNRASGEVTYGLRVVAATADSLVITVENTTSVQNYFIRLFDPGDLRVTYYLNRLKPGVWGYYSLSGIQETTVTGSHRDLYASDAVGEFNHIATMAH